MHGDVGAGVRGGLDEVLGEDHRQAADLGELCRGKLGIPLGSVQAGADGGGSEVDLQEQLGGPAELADLFAHEDAVDHELLPQGHRDGVLELGASHLQDVLELLGLGVEGDGEVLDLCLQRLHDGVQGDPESARVRVVGRLALVHVIVGVDHVIPALGQPQMLQGEVRNDLVGVHVDRGPGAALEDVNRELVHAAAIVQHGVAAGDDGVGHVGRDGLHLLVRHG